MRRAARLLAAVALTTAAGLISTGSIGEAPTASAATCATASGVSVVVDFQELGGVETGCVAGGGGDSAASLFVAAAHTLTRTQRFPGAVCKVDGLPGDAECVNMPPADAYWGLWWSDGESGTWAYSTEGVDGLNVPDGGYVALSWNNSDARTPPGVPPTAHESEEPSPTPEPTEQPSNPPNGNGGGGSSSPPAGGTTTAPPPSPSAAGSAQPDNDQRASQAGQRDKPGDDKTDPKGKPKRSAKSREAKREKGRDEPSASATSTTVPIENAATADPPAVPDDGLPAWVAPVLIGVLFAGAAAAFVVRRRLGG